MPEPHRTASGVVAVSPLVLLTVATDAGVVGHSITFSYSPAAHKPLGDLMKTLEPLAVGQPLAPVTLSDQMHGRFKLLDTQGLVGMALAGIDMALWDAFARAQGLPLHRALGAAARPILEHVEWWNPIVREPLEVRDGMAYVSERVGSGVEFNEDAVQRYLA